LITINVLAYVVGLKKINGFISVGKKLAQDSSATFKGIIYQFYEALDWCFELSKEQSLYFEKYGDIAITDSINIEVKQYKENLTDSHENLWNTLSNWTKPPFDHTRYQKLLLITTQPIGPKSHLINWNQKTLKERVSVLREILESRKQKGALSISQSFIFDKMNDPDFLSVIEKFELFDCSPGLNEKFDQMVNSRAKHVGVLVKNREALIQSLLGFMMTPKVVVGNGWSISESEFSIELEYLSEKFKTNSRVFPSKSDVAEVLTKLTGNELYIKKLKDIEYEEIIVEAHSDYAQALTIIGNDFEQGIRSQNYATFSEEIFRDFNRQYRYALRNSKGTIADSQNFFDTVQSSEPPNLIGYEHKPYKWFRAGVIHINMDDPQQALKWKLK